MKNIRIAVLALILAVPMLFISDAASAHYRWHHCYSCTRGGMPLVYHVVRELRADATTMDQPIWVSASGHQVTLTGGVGNVAQKYRAVQIARYTCGVSLVVDNLHVIQPSY